MFAGCDAAAICASMLLDSNSYSSWMRPRITSGLSASETSISIDAPNCCELNSKPGIGTFLLRFAGSGEEMEGTSGQFTFRHWPSASAFVSHDNVSLGDWRDARLFYSAMNGDSVFIKPDGSTAWHVLETNAMIPIASSLEEFIAIYADFRNTHEVFDSWAYRQFRDKDRTK